MPDTNDTGYGKPPKKSQFKPGQSGNPKGRPKGAKSLKSAVKKELSGKIKLTLNGKQKNVSKLEALLMRLMKDALEGKARAQAEILKLAGLHMSNEELVEAALQPATEADQALINAFLQRMMKEGATDE